MIIQGEEIIEEFHLFLYVFMNWLQTDVISYSFYKNEKAIYNCIIISLKFENTQKHTHKK